MNCQLSDDSILEINYKQIPSFIFVFFFFNLTITESCMHYNKEMIYFVRNGIATDLEKIVN